MSEEESSLTTEELQKVVAYAVSKYGINTLAHNLGVSKATVECWLKGENFPHPAMRLGSMKVLKQLLEESKKIP